MKPENLFYIAIAAAVLFQKKAVGGIYGMKKSKFLPPYDTNGKTTFKNTQGKSGVYIIKEKGKTVYIGYSKNNLYRTLYRHFQAWTHKYQEVTSYKDRLHNGTYTVRVILTTPTQAQRLEGYLINRQQPRDNQLKIKYYQEHDTAGAVEYRKAEDLEPMPF